MQVITLQYSSGKLQGKSLVHRQPKQTQFSALRVYCVKEDYRKRNKEDVRVVVFGATGYIGRYNLPIIQVQWNSRQQDLAGNWIVPVLGKFRYRFVVKELINRGYKVVAFSREKSGIGGKNTKKDIEQDFADAEVVFGDVTDMDTIQQNAFKEPVDVVVSCLASRTGGKKDSWLVDYQATKNTLDVAQSNGVSHYVLLSAICVQRPLLEFQKAKLKFEDDLQNSGTDITYSIVRPTAFFKSLAGQVEIVKGGGPYVYFGDGELAACKPISEGDLAKYIADCVEKEDKINKVLPIGGPGPAYNPKEQAKMLYDILGIKPKFIGVPVAIMDAAINFLSFLVKYFPNLEDSEEFARIGKYYATESMLIYDQEKQQYDADATPSYGEETLKSFFQKAVKEGLKGQELGDQAVFGMK